MKREDYVKFSCDVRRLRSLTVVAFALATLTPSVVEMFRQDLSPVTVLLRLVLALVVLGALVWFISWLVLHFALVQTTSAERVTDNLDDEGGLNSGAK